MTFFFFLVGLGLNSGFCTCKAGAPPLDPHLQSYTSTYILHAKHFTHSNFTP
jgi:hypothetical protein